MQYLMKIAVAVSFIFSAGCASNAAAPIPSTVHCLPSHLSPAQPAAQPKLSIADPEQAMKSLIESYKAGNYDASLLMAGALNEQHTGTAWHRRSLFLIAQIFIRMDRPDEANAAMLRVKTEYPEMADYAMSSLADYHFSMGRFAEAAALYKEITDQYPLSSLAVRASYQHALALLNASKYKEAAALLDAFLRNNPRSEQAGEARLALARALVSDGRIEPAVQAYREVWTRYPGTSAEQVAVNALSALFSSGIPAAPWTGNEWYERARNLYQSGQYDKSAEAFGKMLETAPGSRNRAEALLRIGVSLFYSGRRTEAAASLEKLVKEYPGNERVPEALYWTGRCYSRLGEREKAVKVLLKIVETHSQSEWADDALFQIGNVYRDANDARKSLAYYTRLAAEYPESRFADSSIWWNAWAYYNAGDYRKTESTLQELINRYPRSFLVHQALYWQGRAAEKMVDSAKAAAYFRKALKRGRYTYYGYRAAERLAAMPASNVPAPARDSSIEVDAAACEENCLDGSFYTETGKEPLVWTEESRRLLAAESSFRKILELMYLDMRKEAAAELSLLQEKLPRKQGTLIGLGKAFFELGDYYRSLMLVLANYEQYLDSDAHEVPSDLWMLAYPQGYWNAIRSYSGKYGLDPYFIAAIIRQESRFRAEALSPAGARGVMQVMPATGEWIAQSIKMQEFDRSKLFEADTAINLGAWYINHLMQRFKGDPLLVAAAYNAGPEAVASWIRKSGGITDRDEFVESIPFAETRGYVKKVLRNHKEYRRIYGKADQGAPRVQEAAAWEDNGTADSR